MFTPIGQKEEEKKTKIRPEKRKNYWFKIGFGKWEDGSFDPKVSEVFVSAWDALHAAKKALNGFESEEGEVITSVEYLGYPQV